jgi:transcriptional regulator of acetoin/glycerol metabolism
MPMDLGLATEPDEPTSASLSKSLSGDAIAERKQLIRTLSQTQGIVAHAASLLGISRQALYRRMDRLGVELERRPKADSDGP